MRHFIDHWQLVNSYLHSLGRPELVLPDGTTRDLLIRVFAAVPRQFTARDAALRYLWQVRTEHRRDENELHRRMRELQIAVHSSSEGRPAIAWRPVFAALDAGGSRWISALDTAANAWQQFNDRLNGAPLTLSDGFSIADFQALIASYRSSGRETRIARCRWRHAYNWSTAYRAIGGWAGRYRTFVRFRLGLPESLREPFPFQHPGSYRPQLDTLALPHRKKMNGRSEKCRPAASLGSREPGP